MKRASSLGIALATVLFTSCGGSDNAGGGRQAGPTAADTLFTQLSQEIVDDFLKRHPANATDFGLHTYDGELEDVSAAGFAANLEALRAFRSKVAATDSATLLPQNRIDREFLLHTLDGGILAINDIKRWQRDPDYYASGVTSSAYVIMRRPYAPAAERLKSLIARERKMPAMLQTARVNLVNPPRIYTEIALSQIDGNISFFKNDLPGAFIEVTDSALLKEFRQTNDSVMAALADYKQWMQKELLPKSNGDYAYGAELYQKALAADDMIDVPLTDLLVVAEANRKFNEEEFQAAARRIDSTKSPTQVLSELELDHPPPDKLLQATQATLDSLRQFLIDKRIITIPVEAPSAQVLETPPFMRATTSASMETPGPLETVKLDARYNMTLPDPRWAKGERDDFMRQWYYAMISNVSVHEVYPGHYTQFLHAKNYPSMVRKLFGAASNAEGWAHYTEQMMLDEGFHNNDPKYRLAQAQDALLRNIRFIVGIKMHTQGMTVAEATKLFQEQGHQVKAVAESEAKRGTSDALYGYYTMGKLMILKLRDDYKAKLGKDYSLQKFHDEFIKLGPLPLPLVRKTMLGETGKPFP